MATTCCRIIDVRGDIHPARLSELMLNLFAWMAELTARGGLAPPELLSACRSREMQLALQAEWDAGHREGLLVRPVSDSKHLPDAFGQCHAFDLGNDPTWLYTVGPVVAHKWPGIEWGGTYLPPDIRHFEEE